MAAYNAADYISEAISSILQQTMEDYELLIVNDGSTDQTVEVVQSFVDPRIRLIHNDKNMGLVFTRNRALEEARGEFIAVLDSDDIAVPERLGLQYEFMRQNPAVGLSSGHAALIDESGQTTGDQFVVPTGNNINKEVFFGNPFINPAAIFKTEILKELKGYRDFAPAEDFDFFLRVSEKYPVGNIDHLLVQYRVHGRNTSAIQPGLTREIETQILKEMYKRWGMPVEEQLLALHHFLYSKNYSALSFPEIGWVLNTLKRANQTKGRFPPKELEAFLFEKWYAMIMIKRPGKAALPLLFKKGLFDFSFLTFRQLRRAFKQSFWAYVK